MLPLVWIAAGVGLVVVAILAMRVNEIFFVSVRDGRCLIVRGRVPGALLDGMSDVVRRSRVARGSIRAVRSEGHARLAVRGMDEGTAQRLRNVFGTHPIQKLRAAQATSNRNLGQLLGLAWLAWLLAGAVGASGNDRQG